MTSIVQSPFALFVNKAGDPLELGKVFIGEAGKDPRTNPVDIFSDEAMIVPIEQPIRTLGGKPVVDGRPVTIYTPSTYSILVQNRNGVLIYSSADQGEEPDFTAASGLAPSAYLAPITLGDDAGVSLPNLDTEAQTLTFTPNTTFYNGDIAFELEPGTDILTVDLFFTASVTKIVYLDMTDKSFVVRNPLTVLTPQQRADWLLIATVRTGPNEVVHDVGINSGYTIDGIVAGGNRAQSALLAPIIPGATLPNLDTENGNLVIPAGTVIFTSEGGQLVGGTVIPVEDGDRVFYNTQAGPNFMTFGASVVLDNEQEGNLVLVATVRLSSNFNTLGINSDFTVDEATDNERWEETIAIEDTTGLTSSTTATATFERAFGIVHFSAVFENINTTGLTGNSAILIGPIDRPPLVETILSSKLENIQGAETSVVTLRNDGLIVIERIVNGAPASFVTADQLQNGNARIAISGSYRFNT